ncbi:hypothetical protein [Streptomyces sp. MA15]|uniref:hypothetical protein n=1 Tax=Streptomyces sp. MA15 TaxID=3055061 RepID=UPI0025B19C8A|nr:hypothetical protein [Streptomyces sp. MA15]MDN3270914.1 hypothetical protein [Streptomyces sp. MA15]
MFTGEPGLPVEVKSVRPTAHLRLVNERRGDALKRMFARAYEQIDHTAALITDGRKEFTGVPADRPVHGSIMTMEPFRIVNAPVQLSPKPTRMSCRPVVISRPLALEVCGVHHVTGLVRDLFGVALSVTWWGLCRVVSRCGRGGPG